ncbi:hypothetical protein BCU71_03420 [Vibrio lentus]|nr:hypothetical protein BCU71_03420 [Vibrio lentus]PMK70868.1 hypothetical protein BCT93_00225 [Vibrio lentus]
MRHIDLDLIDRIYELQITPELHSRIEKFIKEKGIMTTWFLQGGNPTYRKFTDSWTLQSSSWNDRKFYKIKRGGRSWNSNRCSSFPSGQIDEETMRVNTPSFESMVRNIARKYPQHVKGVKVASAPVVQIPENPSLSDFIKANEEMDRIMKNDSPI